MTRLFVAALALAACAEQHVALHAPAPDITPAERVAMFHRLERADQETLSVSQNHGPWELVNSTLILGDGTRVNLPEDLLPVVGEASDTARAARASEAYGHRAETWTYIGLAVLGASVATLIAVETGSVRASVPDEYMFGGAALVTAIPFYVARHEGHEEMVLRMQAFSTYTRDLGIRLDVCAHGLEVVACEAPVSTPSPSQAPGAAP